MSQVQDLAALCDRNILRWSEDTMAKLKVRDCDCLDIEHSIEGVAVLEISQKKELIGRLLVLLEHVLKRLCANLPNDCSGWGRTIRLRRAAREVVLKAVPGLSDRWKTSFDRALPIALKNVRTGYPQVAFPGAWSCDRAIALMLDCDCWLSSREGR